MTLKTDLQMGKLVTFTLIVTFLGTETLKNILVVPVHSAFTVKKHFLRILLCQKPISYSESWDIKDTLLP